jgi:hypothetical protein
LAPSADDELPSDVAFEQFLATRSPIRIVRERFSKPSPDELMLYRHAIDRVATARAT